MKRKRLTQVFPFLLPIRKWQRKKLFYLEMLIDGNKYAKNKSEALLPNTVFETSSLMLNENSGFDMKYQINKVHAKLRKSSIEMETITLDNIYKLMLNFGKLYDIISDEEKKSLITYLIKEIQIYPNGESEQPLKSIEFNFPIYRDGQEVRRLLWEKGNTVETVVLMSRNRG